MKTLSISEAKKSLGAIADSAWENEPVILVRGERLLILQRYDPEPPLRQLPPGYLDDFYSNDPDADLLNLAARSISASMNLDVTCRLVAAASLRAISATE